MPEQAALQERLAALFEKSDGKVTLASLLRAVPDIDERRSWRFFFALFQTVLHLEQGTQEYREGHAYYQRYVKPDRCVRHAAGLRVCLAIHRASSPQPARWARRSFRSDQTLLYAMTQA